MEGRFDALVTVDKRMPREQQIHGRTYGIVVLRAKSNRPADLLPLIPQLLVVLDSLKPGVVREVTG